MPCGNKVISILNMILLGTIFVAAVNQSSDTLLVKDSAGNMKAWFGKSNTQTESPGIWFFDSKQNKRLFIGMNDNDQPGIYIYDNEGEIHWFKNYTEPETKKENAVAISAPESKVKINWPRDNIKVYVNNKRTDKEFHKYNKKSPNQCPGLYEKYPRQMTVAEARKRDMVPCKRCFPEAYMD